MFVATVAPYIPCGTELMLTATIVMSIWLLIEIGFHLIAINADTGMWFVFYGGGTGAFIGVVAAWWIYLSLIHISEPTRPY